MLWLVAVLTVLTRAVFQIARVGSAAGTAAKLMSLGGLRAATDDSSHLSAHRLVSHREVTERGDFTRGCTQATTRHDACHSLQQDGGHCAPPHGLTPPLMPSPTPSYTTACCCALHGQQHRWSRHRRILSPWGDPCYCSWGPGAANSNRRS